MLWALAIFLFWSGRPGWGLLALCFAVLWRAARAPVGGVAPADPSGQAERAEPGDPERDPDSAR